MSGQLALQHVGEVIRQEQDLAAILLQRLVELIVLEMLRITKNAIHKNVQVGYNFVCCFEMLIFEIFVKLCQFLIFKYFNRH